MVRLRLGLTALAVAGLSLAVLMAAATGPPVAKGMEEVYCHVMTVPSASHGVALATIPLIDIGDVGPSSDHQVMALETHDNAGASLREVMAISADTRPVFVLAVVRGSLDDQLYRAGDTRAVDFVDLAPGARVIRV